MTRVFILLACVLFLSCKKNQLGGKSTIKGTVLHHSRFIAYARVFVKFNATEFPGSDTTRYDARILTDNEGNFTINCYKGDYYLYGVGFDDQLPSAVYGGVPVHLRNKEVISAIVPVLEP